MEIHTLPGYLPLTNDTALFELYRTESKQMFGCGIRDRYYNPGSTDMGDVSAMLAVMAVDLVYGDAAAGRKIAAGKKSKMSIPDYLVTLKFLRGVSGESLSRQGVSCSAPFASFGFFRYDNGEHPNRFLNSRSKNDT